MLKNNIMLLKLLMLEYITKQGEMPEQPKLYYKDNIFEQGIYLVKYNRIDESTLEFYYRFLKTDFVFAVIDFIIKDYEDNIKLIKGSYEVDSHLAFNLSNLVKNIPYEDDKLNIEEDNIYIFSSLDTLMCKIAKENNITNFKHSKDCSKDNRLVIELDEWCAHFTKYFCIWCHKTGVITDVVDLLWISEKMIFNTISGNDQLIDYVALWINSIDCHNQNN